MCVQIFGWKKEGTLSTWMIGVGTKNKKKRFREWTRKRKAFNPIFISIHIPTQKLISSLFKYYIYFWFCSLANVKRMCFSIFLLLRIIIIIIISIVGMCLSQHHSLLLLKHTVPVLLVLFQTIFVRLLSRPKCSIFWDEDWKCVHPLNERVEMEEMAFVAFLHSISHKIYWKKCERPP